MNNLERAVVTAARRLADNPSPCDPDGVMWLEWKDLVQAVKAYESSLIPGEQEIGWHKLAEGDELKSRKNGRFYPVTKVLKVKAGYEITLAGVPNKIVRPNEAEPSAVVRRGATGQAVDEFVHVFSSGG